jgi:hypothetical protein
VTPVRRSNVAELPTPSEKGAVTPCRPASSVRTVPDKTSMARTTLLKRSACVRHGQSGSGGEDTVSGPASLRPLFTHTSLRQDAGPSITHPSH